MCMRYYLTNSSIDWLKYTVILKQRPIFFATVLKSPDVARNFIVVVLASTIHEKIEIGAGDAQSTSGKPVSVSSDQASRKSTDEADVAICKQEATSSNVGDAECSRHESDSASLSETLSQSPAGSDTVFYTPPSHVPDSDSVSPCQQQSNLHSLVDSPKAPSELKVVVYKRSDSSVGGERRGTDSECSQVVVNAQQRADEVDHYSEGRESVKSEEPLETGDNRDIDIGDDSDSDDGDLSEEKADEMQDYSAADENVATEHQENRSETSMSSTARKRKKRKKKKKNNKQQVKPIESTVLAKSVSSNIVTSETDHLDSLQIKRPPPVSHSETTSTDGDTENKCAQNATSAGSRAAGSTVESTEHSVTSHPLKEDVDNTSRSQLSLTNTLPPTDADSEVGGADDAVSHQRNQDADKHSEQKHLKSGAVGSDSANVSHNARSHRKLKSEKGTGGDENSKHENSEETCEQKLMNTDRDSENIAAQSERMQTRMTKATSTSDAASGQGSSNSEVCTLH